MAFVSLAIIALVAFASPFIASAIPGKPVPETVFLLVFGAVLGPHMLDIIHVDAEVSLVSELGLAFLFLLAGFEIDPKSITGVEGRYGLATWVVTFGIAWLAVRFTPWFSVSHFDGIAVTLALTSTALGTLCPSCASARSPARVWATRFSRMALGASSVPCSPCRCCCLPAPASKRL